MGSNFCTVDVGFEDYRAFAYLGAVNDAGRADIAVFADGGISAEGDVLADGAADADGDFSADADAVGAGELDTLVEPFCDNCFSGDVVKLQQTFAVVCAK